MTDNQTDKTIRGYDEVKALGLGDWRWLVGALHARFATGDFATGIALADAIAAAAEEAGHHPDLDLRYPHLSVRLLSHDVGGVTDRDLRLARRISELAAARGVAAAPDAIVALELGLDTADHATVLPFWRALLGYDDSRIYPGREILDGAGRLPAVWTQRTEAHETPRQRWHLDVIVPIERAQDRIDAALAAGGTLVSDEAAPAFWVLADPEGNKACVCTPEGRSEAG
ncbi:VOC family protein [Nocardioides soli]|uniref:Putative pterin-4-alpha-carbinolamine dehydratase n=1 Tax=Nocardioides soli TaxID=1036020 RepID=A0A7W4VXH5_9ACTN|nr:VOC family protein [Nocardioides soli]MBB3043599.1 4a-hydroxytetrahydrobiopterin dehydratase [Nocardioides soli]